jgi:predicted kinase
MSTVVMPVGIPGCGKTTVLRREAERRGAVYVCPDDVRQELTGNAANQACSAEAWSIVYQRIAHNLQQGRDVVLDATNTQGELRRFVARFCRIWSNDLQLELWWFCTPFEECVRRNNNRDRVVPMEAMLRMRQQLLDDPIDMIRENYDLLVVVKE